MVIRLNESNNEAKQSIPIWELYEIHPLKPRKLIKYDTWTPNQDELNKPLKVSSKMNEKFIRRKDLQVRLLQKQLSLNLDTQNDSKIISNPHF